MVLANRYNWQLFLKVTGHGSNGKSIMAEIATMLAGTDNVVSVSIETLESSREPAAMMGYSLIRLPYQKKWSGDGAGLKAIPAEMRCLSIRDTGTVTQGIFRR